MKSFLIKLLCFSLILTTVVVGMGFVMYRVELDAYRRDVTLSPDVRYVAIADSRSAQNLNPNYIQGLENLSLNGSQIATWKARMRDVIKANPCGNTRRTFIVEVNPLQFDISRLHRAKDCEKEFSLLWILHPELRGEAQLDGYYWHFIENEFPIRFMLLLKSYLTKQPFHSNLAGCCLVPAEKTGYSKREMNRLLLDVHKHFDQFVLSDEDRFQMIEMKNICASTEWNIMFITYPAQGLSSETMKRFVHDVGGFCTEHNMVYLNLYDTPIVNDGWLDAVHLNRQAVTSFWPVVASAIKHVEADCDNNDRKNLRR